MLCGRYTIAARASKGDEARAQVQDISIALSMEV